ncbi:MAG: M48 family metalloprotease [Herminiimonas sp.]|nr:M48 family metalloprotease [Herminiimonas sp.]
MSRQRIQRRAARAVTLSLGVLLAGCAAVPTTISDKMPAIPGFTPKQDKTIVERLRAEDAADKVRPAPATPPTAPPDPLADLDNRRIYSYIVPSPPLSAYLNGLLQRVRQASPRPDLPAHVYALYDNTLVADTTPAGNIFLSLGWLKQVESEDELLAVLAHEYGHIALHHYDFDEIANNQKRLKLLSTGFFVLRQVVNTGNASATLTKGDTDRLKTQENLIQVMDAVIHPGWKRAQELDADKYALDTLMQMKRAPKGLTDFFEHVDAQDTTMKLAAEKAAKETIKTPDPAAAAAAAAAKFSWGDLLDPLLVQLKSATHPSAAERSLSIDTYRDLFYPTASQPVRIRPDMGGLAKVRTENKQLFANYEKAREAEIKLKNGDAKEALKLARLAASGPTAKHAYPLAQQFQAQMTLRQTKDADATFNLITRADDPTWKEYDFYLEHSQADQKAKDGMMEAGFQKFHEAPTLQAARIAYYKKSGNLKLANQLVITCTARTPDYRDGCEKSLK